MTATRFVPQEEWRPPPPAALFGELDASGTRIILLGQGGNWELGQMGARLKHITPLISKLPGGAVSVPATWAAVTQIGFSFPGNGSGPARLVPLPRLREWILAEFARRTSHGILHPHPYPDGLTPRPYQEAGALAIASAGKFLLCDDPGLGKSACAILGLLERETRGYPVFPCVIVVPSWDVADVWAREIAGWAPRWGEPVMYGGANRAEGRDVRAFRRIPGSTGRPLITTYATARIDAADADGPLVRLRPAAVVADEIHWMANPRSKQSLAVRRIAAHAGTVIGLSGTPVKQDTGDIFPVLNAIDPQSWPSRDRFVKRYCQVSDSDYGEVIEGLNRASEPEFRAVLLGSMRRVAKQDVLSQLPPKVYSVRRTEIPPEWRIAYDGMRDDMLAQLPDGGELPVMETLAQMTRLSQLASSAADVKVTTEVDELTGLEKPHYEVTLKSPSWKADALLGILAERRGQPVVAFAVSRQLIMIAGAACEQAGYRCGYITGQHGKAERTRAISDFQAGRLDVILATTGAGGTGITLTAAGTVVFLQRPWSLADALQAEDRAHRLGSERHEMIEIIDVIARDTIDESVRKALREKAGQLGEFVRDPRIVRELLGGLK